MKDTIKNQYLFYFSDLRKNLELEGPTAFQINKVLRLKLNDKIGLVDGKGNKGIYKITQLEKDCVSVNQIELIQLPPLPPLILAFGLLKGDKNELVLQKSLELGATKVIVFEAERSVPKIKESSKKIDRYKKIMTETMEQCLGLYLPEIEFHPNLQSVLDSLPEQSQIFTLSFDAQNSFKDFEMKYPVVIIGPEGDFSENEFQLMKNAQAESVLLCPHLLKAETASIAALAQINLLRL